MVHQKAGRKLDGLGLTYLETLWDDNGFNPIVKSFWLLALSDVLCFWGIKELDGASDAQFCARGA